MGYFNATRRSFSSSRRTLYCGSAIAILAATLLFFGLGAGQGRGLYMTSGAWAGLAADLADGTFYRPVHSADGFGGTRYMPLQFVLHGLFLSIINRPVLSAYLVVVPAAAALVLGVYRLLRSCGLPAQWALPCSMPAMAAFTFQYGLISTRGDMLAAALNMWGVVMCAAYASDARNRSLLLGAAFFALAFMTKFTTVFGLAACVLYFVGTRRRRGAFILSGVTACFAAGMLAAVHVASDGRALESFLACASGGTTFFNLLFSPFKFLYAARVDVSFLLFLACGAAAVFMRRQPVRDLPSALFLMTAAATVVIAASPGTDLSHNIDLQAASVVVAAVCMNDKNWRGLLSWSIPIAGFVGAAAVAIAAIVLPFLIDGTRWSQQARIMAIVGDDGPPLLADNPWVPILAEERPFVLDTFAIRTASEQRPEISADLFAKLDTQFFRAVVLYIPRHLRDGEHAINGTWRGKRWYGELFYPPGFEERVLANYEPEAFIGEYIVLMPRT